jgi:hypothetical protein
MIGTLRSQSTRARRLRKILLSLAVGVATYVVATLATGINQLSQLVAVTGSVLVGGLAMVIQVVVEFESRLSVVGSIQQAHSEHMESMVKAGFSKINEATELFSLVEASALRSDVVIQLVRNSTQLDPASPTLISRFAQAEIGRVSEFLKELADGGNVTYDGEDRDWMLALTHSVDTSIDATSLSTVDTGGKGSVDAGLWTSDLGQRYLDAQRDALQRGVRIRRVFIMGQPDLAGDKGFLDVCHRQRDMGIQVRVLDSSSIPGTRRTSLFDFVLFDDVVSYEVTPASPVAGSTRPTIVNTRLELRRVRVRDRIQRFKDLWASAHELE